MGIYVIHSPISIDFTAFSDIPKLGRTGRRNPMLLEMEIKF
jgi:hypothetical protein